MTNKKKIFIILLGLSGYYNSYADNSSWAFLNQGVKESAPLVCTIDDKAWFDKSGPDSVKYPKIESDTLFLQADSITGQNKGNQILEGNVVGYKDGQTLSADWLIYNQPTSRVTTGDNMVLTRQYDTIAGKWADYYLDLDKGTFTQARVYYESANLTTTGNQVNVVDKNHYNMQNGIFTSCDPNNPAWYLQAQKINIDYQDSSGTARNATMYFESVPIFATPYMTFPLGQRKSGWLTPSFGATSTAGFMASDPYYWNMAPNYDMTITPEIWANQGFMLTDQFRYMSESNVGSIYTEQMPSNWQGQYRYYWSLNDTYSPITNVQTGYRYNSVSDGNYFNDFGNFYSVTNNVNLDQSVFAKWTPTWGNADVTLQNYQTVLPLGYTSTVPIYSSYPAINFNVKPQDIGNGFKASWTSNFTNFYSPAMQSGDRTVLYPSILYPMQATWGSSTPKLGYSYSYYNIGNIPGIANTSGQFQRALPIASWDNSLYFDRPLTLGDSSYTQTIEPRLYYLYIPQVNQASLTDFDTATATFNLNQLFSENRYSGFDRINSANDITVGATTRLINDSSGNELMNLGVGYRYYITPQDNFLYGNPTQYSQLFLPNPNLITELTNNWSRTVSTTAGFQYDTVYDTIDAYAAGVKFNPDDYKVVNLRFRYQYQVPLLYYGWTPGQAVQNAYYENQYAADLSAQWPIYENKLFAIGRANYDFTIQQPLNILGGVEYNGGCWTVSAIYGQFISNLGLLPGGTTLQSYVQQTYYLQFSFKGIGGVGTGDPTSDMKINIPGYMSVSQTPYQVQ